MLDKPKPVESAEAPSMIRMLKDEALTSLPGGLVRGLKDIVDTGAQWLATGYDKATGGDEQTLSSLVTGQRPGEGGRVRRMNEAGKQDFKDAQERAGAGGSDVSRVVGNIVATAPVGGVLGFGAKTLGATRLGNSIATGGFTTGAPAAATAAGKVVDLGLRTAGGAVAGGASAGLVDPDSAGTGALIGAVLPGAVKLAGAAGRAFKGGPSTVTAQQIAAGREGAKAGYVIPPVDLDPGMFTKLMSGLSGKIKTSQVASERNQKVTDALARRALGLADDAELSPEVLQGVRRQAAQGYAPVRNSGVIQADQGFLSALDSIAATSKGASRSFPGLRDNGVEDLIASVRQSTFDAGDAVDATKQLRELADQAYMKGDKTVGKAAKSAADELENVLERQLSASGNPNAVQSFQDARRQIAKTYSVQKALNPTTGAVSAPRLAADLAKGRPLSEELLTIAQMGQAFPKATQALKEAPGTVSPLDWLAAGGVGLGAASTVPAAGVLLARPLARQMLLSKPVQRRALQEAAPTNPALQNSLAEALRLGYQSAPVAGTSSR
ncbi:MAG: hypothetical protein Q8N06_02750 [Hydrogenophaga sp.]|nr:hypothetical protein [Hydrogenophaga sp.]